MTEMQECLHEEECKRREVRLFQLQGVCERLAGCPLLSQVPLLPGARPVTGVQMVAAMLALSRSACQPTDGVAFGGACRRKEVGMLSAGQVTQLRRHPDAM